MEAGSAFLDSQLQSLQEMHRKIPNLPDEFVASIEQMQTKALAVNKRCLQLVAELEEARQEELMLQAELHEIHEQCVGRS